MATDLYRRVIEWSKANSDEERHELTLKCWRDRPWMTYAYTGRSHDDRTVEMLQWCGDAFGKEAWPLHDKPGSWYRGGVTINGWTWMGFETEDMMNRFLKRWPNPEDEATR